MLISINPTNYEVLGRIKFSSEEEIMQIVKKAHFAKNSWKTIGFEERVKLLKKVVEKFAGKKEELSLLTTKEMGMPIAQSKADVRDAIDYFTWYLDNTPFPYQLRTHVAQS